MARLEVVRSKRAGTLKLAVHGPVPERLVTLLRTLTDVTFGDGEFYVPLEMRLVQILRRSLPNAELHPSFVSWLEEERNFSERRLALKELKDVDIGPLGRNLFPYQRVGANFLAQAGRALLADDPGTGKTAQGVVATALRDGDRVLIVCPNSLKLWWRSEIDRWNPGRPCHVINGTAKSRARTWQAFQSTQGYLIINWEQVQRMPELADVPWDWIVLDEAHRAKNRTTKTFKALTRLSSTRIALLTATPFANDPSEVWALLHLCYPQRYTSFWRFYNTYVSYVETPFGRKVLGVRNGELLSRELAPLMLRRSKRELGLGLPARHMRTIPLRLTAPQEKLYRQMATAMFAELSDGTVLRAWSTVAQIARLRQIVSTTATLQPNDYSSKLDAFFDLFGDEGPSEQWVVFSMYRATVDAVMRRCKERGISAVSITGETPMEEREESVRAFQQGKAQIFAATLGVGGVGLNLQNARFLVLTELHYNPTVNEQAADRCHRLGSTQDVLITVLHCVDTVDDLVRRIVERKVDMIEAVLRAEFMRHLEEVQKGV